MMTPHTVQQLLQVFRLFYENHASGMPLSRSYHEAVRAVAKNFSVTYQTIGDGCRRRLELANINELYEMLSAWLRGEPHALVSQLKKHSDPITHAIIEKFFSATESAASPEPKVVSSVFPKEESVVVPLRLPVKDARLFRALAELDGPDAIARMVSAAVRDRMKIVARDIILE